LDNYAVGLVTTVFSSAVTIHTAGRVYRQIRQVHMAIREQSWWADFTEISAVKLLLPHFAHFTALKQCRERLLILFIRLLIFITGIFKPFI